MIDQRQPWMPDDLQHQQYMTMAFQEAQLAEREDEVPVGAIIVQQGRVIASAHNQREALNDPTAHAEMLAITQAADVLKSWRLIDCVMYVTLEPCVMCSGAILQARVPMVVFGAKDAKGGAVYSNYQLLSDDRLNHQADVIPGILEEPCGQILSHFFQEKRKLGKK